MDINLYAVCRFTRKLSLHNKRKWVQAYIFYVKFVLAAERPVIPDVRFRLSGMSDADAVIQFRFDTSEIQVLACSLRLPNIIITSQRDKCHREEGLCIVLGRLSYPSKFHDMINTFGRSREQMCRIFNFIIGFLFDEWGERLYCPLDVVEKRISSYAAAIRRKGSLVSNVFAFPDGTKFETCRITPNDAFACENGRRPNLQRMIYSGHKRRHCLNYQALTAPDGICVHFWGAIAGSCHDTTMLRESKLLEFFDSHGEIFNGYCIYGDPAYGMSRWIMSGFKGSQLTSEQKMFNSSMSKVRTSVEWNFQILKKLWSFCTFKDQQKIMISSIAKNVAVAMLLTNCHCCIRNGNKISYFFDLPPPSLHEYLKK
ncbi:hypothetical protein Ae201684_016603 [Aphanomyces euteiches]|uniref:DDE Tnp4 domain-containing protein n=1 Tax=Aphanomyces euteiches TaxID=100861 RepID=A0A6G0WDV9_9STRA|nr:hypothetical protein Ae201684_016603 [Aphanomyces euteiches]KAH9153518.1 hypothetical protein AeRB84_004248 [Aphanomyces euteiches]